MDKFKVGDYVIFRKSMHKVADMLNTSSYDVLTSVHGGQVLPDEVGQWPWACVEDT